MAFALSVFSHLQSLDLAVESPIKTVYGLNRVLFLQSDEWMVILQSRANLRVDIFRRQAKDASRRLRNSGTMTTLGRAKRTFPTVGVTLCLGLAMASFPAIAQDQNEFPGRRVGGGTRGGCAINAAGLVAVHPANNLGVTNQERPTLYFAVPESPAAYQITFALHDSEAVVPVYEKTVEVGYQAELIGFQVPANALEAGQYYQWSFVASCETANPLRALVLDGWLQQAEDLPEIMPNSDAVAQVQTYQAAGLWSDAIALAAELLAAQPDSAAYQAQWFELLADLELDTVIDELLPVRLPNELE